MNRRTLSLFALTVVVVALLLSSPMLAQGVIAVPSLVTDRIQEILPEQSNEGAAFVSEVYSPNLVVTERATVDIVLLWEGAGYRNSLGWFLFREDAEGSLAVLERGLLIPDATIPNAVSIGLRVTLRDANGAARIFEPGDRVGFFVVADGWNREARIRAWDPTTTPIPAASPSANAGFGRGCYTSVSRANPEHGKGRSDLARHCAMIDMPGVPGFLGGERYLMTGFEDLDRTTGSDDDFNDLVFVVQSTPIEAIAETPAFRYDPGDPDGDGVRGLDDHYPDDPGRATVTRYPSHGVAVLALEDEYPSVGDADYNDCVVGYVFEIVTDADGRMKDILGTFHLLARGSVHNHGFGLHLPGLPEDAAGTVRIERFLSDSNATHQLVAPRDMATVIAARRRIADILPFTMQALPGDGPDTVFANTTGAPVRAAASARIHIEFTAAIDALDLGPAPFDPYFQIHRGGLRDVHLPGRPGFADREAGLPDETGARSFVDANGYPFVLELPTSWRFPLERNHVANAYPDFGRWRSTSGAAQRDWYMRPSSAAGAVSVPVEDNVPARAWTVALPRP